EEPVDGEVVREAAVEEVEIVDLPQAVRTVAQVIGVARELEGLQIEIGGEASVEARSDPLRDGPALAVTHREVLEGHRGEHDGHRGGSGHARGDQLLVELGADVVEALGGEREDFARGHVGGVEDQIGLAGLVEVDEGLALEELVVEELLYKVDAGGTRDGEARARDVVARIDAQRAHVVGHQEIGSEALQAVRAIESEVGGDDAAPRDGGDYADVVDEAPALPLRVVAELGDLAQDDPAEGCRARATA